MEHSFLSLFADKANAALIKPAFLSSTAGKKTAELAVTEMTELTRGSAPGRPIGERHGSS